MTAFQTVLLAVLPVFTVALAGFFMRRITWLTAEADASLFRVLINLLVPCFFLDSVLGNPALENPGNVLLPPLIGFGTVSGGILLSRWLQKPAGLSGSAEKRTFAFVTGTFNYGYIPIPLALSLFNRETAGVLIVHNLGVEVALWTVGLLTLGGIVLKDCWKRLLNPPLITILLAMVLNFTGWNDRVPGFLTTTFQMLGQCAIPVGIILIGASLADLLPEFKPANSVRVMTTASVLRLGLFPLLFLLLAKYGPFTVELKRVILIQASMPAAVFPIIMTRHYGGNPSTALKVVLSTSTLAFLTIPLWLKFGLGWVLE